VLLVITALVSDMISVILNGRPGYWAGFFNNFLNMILYSIGVFISFFWMLYVDHHIFKSNSHIKKNLPIILIPLVINLVLSVLSMFENIYFNITAENLYERGQFFILNFGINYMYLLSSVYLIIRFNKLVHRKDTIPLLMFPILPLVGSVIQIFNYGVLLIWPMAALSLMIVFIFIQSRLINVDVLTELYNKREFNDYVLMVSKRSDYKKMIGGIILDIDDFKKINDTFGHAKGDLVLKEFSGILRKSFRRDDFISRIGGDEFAIMIEVDRSEDFEKAIERLKTNVDFFNKSKTIDIKIDVSIGSEIYDPTKYKNFEDFIISLDYQMYQNKKHAA
jgi:diguanylate cyclase (GGDEF)-like protein